MEKYSGEDQAADHAYDHTADANDEGYFRQAWLPVINVNYIFNNIAFCWWKVQE